MSLILVSDLKIMKYIYLNVFQQVDDEEDSDVIIIDSDVEEVVEEVVEEAAADSDDSIIAQAGSENEAMNQ